jgi:hypothetical protein
VAPLWLGGLRGKQSTPSDWLGGTGEVSTVGKRERHGARTSSRRAIRQWYAHLFSRVECIVIYFIDYNGIVVKTLIQLL